MKKGLTYGLKFLGWFILGILVLLILAGLLIQTSPVQKKLTNVASKQASRFLNGNISLDKIEGNFFTHLELNNILWEFEKDTVAFISNLNLKYDLRPLLHGRLLIQSVEITEPFFHLKQVNDSTWNIQELIKSTAGKADSSTSSGNFQLDLQAVQLSEGEINFDTKDSIIPEQIQQLNTDLSFHWDRLHQSLQLNNFSFQANKPSLVVTQLTFNVSRDTSVIDLTDFRLKTQQNQLSGNGTFQPPAEQAEVHFESAPLHPGEFEFLLPNFKIPAKPEFKLNADLENDSLIAAIDLKEDKQEINLNFSVAHFREFLSDSPGFILEYRLNGDLQNINLAHWTGNSKLDYLINGNLTAKGKGIDPKTAVVALSGNLKDFVIKNKPVDNLKFDFNLDHGLLNGKAEGDGDFGHFNLNPEIKNLFGTPDYNLQLTTKQFNLAKLLDNDSLQSDINMTAMIKGHGFEPKTLTAEALINATESRLNSISVDTLLADVKFGNNNFQIDSLLLKTHSAILEAHGSYALQSNSELWLNARFDSIAQFAQFLPVSGLHTSGVIDAYLRGTKDSLNLESTLQLDSTRYNSLFLENLKVNATAEISQTDTLFNANLVAVKLQNNELLIDSVLLDVKSNTDSMFVNGQIADNDVRTSLEGTLNWQQQLRLTLQKWTVDYKDQHLALQQPPAVIEIDSVNYQIHNFKMASDPTDSAQVVIVEGSVNRIGNQDLEIKVNNVDVGKWMELLETQVKTTGSANFNLKIEGTSVSPVLKGDFGVNDAKFNTFTFTDFGGSFDYADNKLNLQTNIVPTDSGRIELSGFVPIQITLDSFKFNFNPKDSVDLQLKVDKFPLAALQTLKFSENMAGFIDGNVTVTGTTESPDPNGELKLIDAAFEIPEYGIDYQNILLNISFLRDNISVDTIRIETDDGYVYGSGKIDFSSNFYEGNISQSEIELTFDEFNPVDHRQLNLQVSGGASLSGEKGDVVFDGDLNVPEAEIYLPALLNMMGKIYVPEIPKSILVKELEEQTEVPDSFQIQIQAQDTTKEFELDYFDQLTGKVRINIPKNTWVKNEDLRIEISGDIELIKHENYIELFGAASVIRGQYDMLGKTFVIDEGTIQFEGGEELMPQVDITASYSFRDAQRQKKELSVHITGTPESPSVSFNLDGNAVNEGDALSYILFGRGMNELSMNQQENIAGAGGGQIAAQAAASILSAQISDFLGDKLNVDYIEVKSSGGFENATVMVGKYLTNDLFVSYEQRFGATDQKDISKYEVILEYELFRFLFFQLNNSSIESGFDVIFKLNSK